MESCHEIIDSNICDKENGFTYQVNNSIIIELDIPETFDTMIILSRVVIQKNPNNSFKVMVRKAGKVDWTKPKNVKVKRSIDDSEDSSLSFPSGDEHLQIMFEPVLRIAAIQIEVLIPEEDVVTIVEVLIPRKLRKLFCFYIFLVKALNFSFRPQYPCFKISKIRFGRISNRYNIESNAAA